MNNCFKQKQEEWRIVFFITAAVYAMGAIGFLILGSADIQTWATKKTSEEVEEGKGSESIPLHENN